MPFDALMFQNDHTALYRQRRESAAALWRSIPTQQFVMDSWGRHENDPLLYEGCCGTHGCALGWLALRHHDGWTWIKGRGGYGRPMPPTELGRATFKGAAAYFGMTLGAAKECFMSGGSGLVAYPNRQSIWEITPADVATAVLAAPYHSFGWAAVVSQAK